MARRRSRKIRSNKRRVSRKLRSNSRRRHSRRLSRNVNYALVSNRRRSRKLRSNSRRRASRKLRSNSRRRASRKLRSNSRRRHSRKLRSNSRRRASRKLRSNSRRRHSRKLRSNSRRRHSRKLRSNRRRHSRRLSRNVNYALVSNRRRRHSRKLRSNSRRRHSRRMSRNPNYALVSNRRRRHSRIRRNSAAIRRAIGQEFASKHKGPLVGRIKRLYDRPSKLTYYGAPAYRKSFGKLKAPEAKKYARRLGALVANTLIGSVPTGYAAHIAQSPRHQVVETSEGSRMWNASYPITISAYQTTGYVRDFKLGGVAKYKARAKKGTKLYGTRDFGSAPRKRRAAR